MLELLTDPTAWISFLTLTVLEVILGIDNVIFLSLLVSRLPPAQRPAARVTGLTLAMLTRILLLLSVTWLITLRAPLLSALGAELSGRDLILIAGGLFLLWKSVLELHATVEVGAAPTTLGVGAAAGFVPVLLQISLIDIVFSIDSVFTAVGLAQRVEIMIAAIVIASLAMIVVARGLSAYIERRPTLKLLALAFLILIGVALIADGFRFHIPRGYLYFAMTFALVVELLNGRGRRRAAR